MSEQNGGFPTSSELASITLPVTHGVNHSVVSVAETGAEVVEPIQTGLYQGLTAFTKPFHAAVTSETSSFPFGKSTVEMSALLDLIPIFQFALFFDDDLAFNPGSPMTITGRVHTNADLYANDWPHSNPLRFDGVVTAVDEVYNYDTFQGYGGGVRQFRDADGNSVAMGSLVSASPDWYTDSLARWDGNLRSGAHGVKPLHLPLPDPSHPRVLIEPPEVSDSAAERRVKSAYKADVFILNGVPTDAAGNVVSTIDPITGESAIRPTVILDQREGHEMLTLEIDLEKLGRSPAWPAGGGTVYVAMGQPGGTMPTWGIPFWDGSNWTTTAWPAAWAPYAAHYNGGDTDFAVKLANAEELAGPLTMATDNPAYVRGNYNTSQKQPTAIIADAVTILSRRWGRKNASGNIPGSQPDDDLGYSSLSMSNRRPLSTTYNFSMMTGMMETTPSGSNGGPQNIMRMLENWRPDQTPRLVPPSISVTRC